jgi:glycerol-3-phosphate dehydrogenase
VTADESEIDYLIKVVNRYFKRGLTRGDVVYSFSGVRPLYDDNADNPSAVTRDYIFELDAPTGQAPLLSVFGGKITTFRKLAEHALDRIQPFFPKMGKAWTSAAHLPGGDIADADFEQFLGDLGRDCPWMPTSLLKHYGRLYGTRARALVANAGSLDQLGRRFGKDFFEREANYLFEHEWASTAADILDRRTKHGLHLSAAERAAFEDWCANRLAKAG